ncbi:MAG: hypothetical protein IAE66_06230 [Xanthomonadaceae bacterium]|nr:hypothetical protein [Xanthomonadaceae bacterium]
MTAAIIPFPSRNVRTSWADSAQPLRDYEKQILLLAHMMIDRGVKKGQSLEQIKERLAARDEPSGDVIADLAMVDMRIEMAAEVDRRLRAGRRLDPRSGRVTSLPKTGR